MPVGGGIAGGIFTAGSMAVFLIGIPALRYFLPAAAIFGGAVALAIHFKRHETPGKDWILLPQRNRAYYRESKSGREALATGIIEGNESLVAEIAAQGLSEANSDAGPGANGDRPPA